MLIPNDRLYSQNHIWVLEKDQEIVVGVTDYAQDNIGQVEFLDLPEIGDKITFGGCFGSAESSKAVTDMLSPIEMTITAINAQLDDSPELVNKSPFDKGWLFRASDYPEEGLDQLMNAQAYREYLTALGIE